MSKSVRLFVFWGALFLSFAIVTTAQCKEKGDGTSVEVPFIDGAWWQVAGDPELGKLTSPNQQPVDFAVWQAADGAWQLWSCIRKTKCEGKTRLLYGWEGKKLTDSNWKPVGIKLQADAKYGETPGGLQAPHVVKQGDTYCLLYGDWDHICLATGKDGKKFDRVVRPNGKTGMFSEQPGADTRDIMALRIGDKWYGYYSAYPNQQNAVFCRTSPDLRKWSESRTVAFGGQAGVGRFDAECPHVIVHNGKYYLFRTQKYGEKSRTCVYISNDPLNFGINQDRLHFVCELPIAAPEIVQIDGQDYVAALLPSLKGIQIAKLGWKPRTENKVATLDTAATNSAR